MGKKKGRKRRGWNACNNNLTLQPLLFFSSPLFSFAHRKFINVDSWIHVRKKVLIHFSVFFFPPFFFLVYRQQRDIFKDWQGAWKRCKIKIKEKKPIERKKAREKKILSKIQGLSWWFSFFFLVSQQFQSGFLLRIKFFFSFLPMLFTPFKMKTLIIQRIPEIFTLIYCDEKTVVENNNTRKYHKRRG